MSDVSPYATVPVAEIIDVGMADIDGRPPFRPWIIRRRKRRKSRRRVIFGKRDTVPVGPMLDAFLASIGA